VSINLRVERLISRARSRRSSRVTSLLTADGVMRSSKSRQLDGPARMWDAQSSREHSRKAAPAKSRYFTVLKSIELNL
jgi:hypothetical protein